jgi:exo-1,4-beta-D-glucosaminidase
MFEAFARNKYGSTGVIQWMLNNAWPSVIWHLYDYFLQPAGGYFGAKKALESLHVQYSYDDRGVVVVNNLYRDFQGLTVTAVLYDFDLQQKFSRQAKLDVPADSVRRVLVIPEISPAPKVSFVKLTLQDSGGEVLSSNFYWLPSKPSTFEWDLERQHPYYTPVSAYEDLTMLNHLPRVRLEASATLERDGNGVRVQLHNPSHDLAFQVQLGIHEEKQEDEILPVFWDDNYFSLMPGESRVVVARYSAPHVLDGRPQLEVGGWNVDALTLLLKPVGNDSKKPN